jgi:hypothetical protein
MRTHLVSKSLIGMCIILTSAVILVGQSAPSSRAVRSVPTSQRGPAILGPRAVPGNTQYSYRLNYNDLSDITWSVDSSDHVTLTDIHSPTCFIHFDNDAADHIHLSATANAGGVPIATDPWDIDLVKVAIEASPGLTTGLPIAKQCRAQFLETSGDFVPPDLRWTPGWEWNQFRFTGSDLSPEDGIVLHSADKDGGYPAFKTTVTWKLTALAGHTNALKWIQVGCIQQNTSATALLEYGAQTYRGQVIGTQVPTNDWLVDPTIGPIVLWDKVTKEILFADDWPWFCGRTAHSAYYETPAEYTYDYDDSPSFAFPIEFDPNHADHRAFTSLVSAACHFKLHAAARTIDSHNGASMKFFSMAYKEWQVNWDYPPGEISFVTKGNWQLQNNPILIDVDIISSSANLNSPFRQIIPYP